MDIREMLRHLRRGRSNRAVAEALGIDRKTVARYRSWASEQGLLVGRLVASATRLGYIPRTRDA